MGGYIGTKASVTQVDGYNRTEADDRYVNAAGDTMTGALEVNGNLTVDTNTLFVDATNNRVGFGTSLPSYKLETKDGDIAVVKLVPAAGGNTVNGMRFRVNNSANTAESATLGMVNAETVNSWGGVLTFSTKPANSTPDENVTERMRIDASGNVLVGMTGITSSVNYGGVYIRNDTSAGPTNDYAQLFVQNNSAFNHGIVIKELNTSGNAVRFLNNSGTVVGAIATAASSTSYQTSSDYRLKEDVQPMVGASDRVLALNPVNFAWKADGTRVDGFLAHEAQEVVPEAVSGTKDAVDADGNPDYQGIDQSKLVPLLTAALQEALTEIADLKARVAALEEA